MSSLSFNKKALLFSVAVSTSNPVKSTFEEINFKFSILVSLTVSSILALPFNTSYIVLLSSLLDKPKPVVAFPWGSKSITRIFLPWNESAVARLITVVVFPTPPFWFITEMIWVFLNLFFF